MIDLQAGALLAGTGIVAATAAMVWLGHATPAYTKGTETKKKGGPQPVAPEWRDYAALRELMRDVRLPAMVVDLDVLDRNIRNYARVIREHGKTIRLATKSVRVPHLIRHILDTSEGAVSGLMCYTAAEARFLAEKFDLDHILIGYPSAATDLEDVWAVAESGKEIQVMVDCAAHIEMIEQFWRSKRKDSSMRLEVCMDMDCSFELPFDIHLGPNRSPLRSLAACEALVDRILASDCVTLVGAMGYEAQISGLQNVNPFEPIFMHYAIQLIQWLSMGDVLRRRAQVVQMLKHKGITLRYFNVGGSGSLATSAADPSGTEVTAGSGYLQSHLFDYFQLNENECAFAFALRVTRKPVPHIVTCQSGGFAASGKTVPDKSPIPFIPRRLQISTEEGFGEVQTPLILPPGVILEIGDPIFARPAKAGEIAERFNAYMLKRGMTWVDKNVPTYRGFGHTFF